MNEKQANFVNKLLADREPNFDGIDGTVFERYMDILDGSKFVSMQEASSVIDWLLTQPKKAPKVTEGASTVTLEPGVYVLGDHIVKLQSNKAKTNCYTLRWTVINGERLVETGEHVNGEWVYEPNLKGQLRPEHRMTMEEAKAFGITYGRCAKCSRKLKAAKSVEAAIGPVCGKFFTLV
jgi:hypothetical protein